VTTDERKVQILLGLIRRGQITADDIKDAEYKAAVQAAMEAGV